MTQGKADDVYRLTFSPASHVRVLVTLLHKVQPWNIRTVASMRCVSGLAIDPSAVINGRRWPNTSNHGHGQGGENGCDLHGGNGFAKE
jgi:hypothetical protein